MTLSMIKTKVFMPLALIIYKPNMKAFTTYYTSYH